MKEDIALNYFVSSMMHQMFAFKDLEQNEDIIDYRGKEGKFGMYRFKIDKALEALIKKYPDNCKLYKGLGDFYYEVHLKYEGKWLKDDKELFKRIEENNKKAIDGNCANYLTYHVMGYISVSQEKYKNAIPYFLKSIELDKEYASSYYNVAYAYLYADDRENALKYARRSLDLYTDISYKGDAARMLGQIYSEMKDDKNALECYELSDKIDPSNYYTTKVLLNLYLKSGNVKAEKTMNAFFNLAPTNPTIYNDLGEIYANYTKEDVLIAFYKGQFSSFKENDNVTGNLNFYLGRIYLGRDKKLAKEYFLKAKDIFAKVYAKDHPVFKAIEDGVKQTEN